MKRVTGQGLALQGDGLSRARMRINAAGFPTVSAFVESSPNASLKRLADELNQTDTDSDPLPISTHQLAQLWREEARAGDAQVVERFARRALVGELNHHLPGGWPRIISEESSFPITHAQVTWTSLIGHDLKPRADAVFAALDSLAPAGWLPANASDPIIDAAFERWKDR